MWVEIIRLQNERVGFNVSFYQVMLPNMMKVSQKGFTIATDSCQAKHLYTRAAQLFSGE